MVKFLMKDIQIVSALIWAATILISSYFIQDSNLVNLLITAAGLHMIVIYHLTKGKKKVCR